MDEQEPTTQVRRVRGISGRSRCLQEMPVGGALMKKSTMEAVDTYVNGNHSDFNRWLKRCSKLDMLDAVEYYQHLYGNRHMFINAMRNKLEEVR